MERFVAEASGAVLGFIIGAPETFGFTSVAGAVAGWEAGGKLYDWSHYQSDMTEKSLSIMPKRQREGDSFELPRKKKRVKGKANYKKRRRAKRRKQAIKSKKTFDKKVTKVVKKVMECAENVGTYNKTYTGDFEPYVNAGQYRVAYSMNRNTTNASPHTVFNMSYVMTRKKILDAVSVLFNSKTKGMNWSDPTNLFGIKGLKIDVLYMSQEYIWWNYTEYAFDVEIFEITNKYNTETPFIEDAASMLAADEWEGGVPTLTSATTTAYDMSFALEFGMIKGVNSKYIIKKVKSGRLYPGQSVKYFKKWGHQCIDFTKQTVLAGGVQVLPSYAKGDTQFILRYTPVTHGHTSSTTMIATNLANATSHDYGFLVEVKETFKFFQPAETDETKGGDKRCIHVDWPFLPSGVGPYVQRYMSTGPSYVNLNNPKN